MNLYLKAIIAAAVPLVAALGEYAQSGALNAPEVSLAVLALANAILVAAFRNRSAGVLSAGKFLISAANALVVAALTAWYTGDWANVEWSVLVIGWATSALVYFAGNNVNPNSGGLVNGSVPDRT